MLCCVVPTDKGVLSSTFVEPEAAADKSPGMMMGSGDRLRLVRTAGSSSFPQFFQSKPRSCRHNTSQEDNESNAPSGFKLYSWTLV